MGCRRGSWQGLRPQLALLLLLLGEDELLLLVVLLLGEESRRLGRAGGEGWDQGLLLGGEAEPWGKRVPVKAFKAPPKPPSLLASMEAGPRLRPALA